MVSVVGQGLAGYRLIGEFALQWLFIAVGTVVSFHLGFRLSRSAAASLATFLLVLVVLAGTPTYHYPKLLLYPLALWLAWRYLERPGPWRGAGLGLLTAVAFLFRHDHGIHVGILAAVTLVSTRLVFPAHRNVRALLLDGTACAVTAAVAVAPWIVAVASGEGLADYVRQRLVLYEDWSAKDSPFRSLVRLTWPSSVREDSLRWLEQVTVLVPVLLMLSAGLDVLGSRRRGQPIAIDAGRKALAAVFLALADQQLFRQPSYFVTVAPLTAALGATFLVRKGGGAAAAVLQAVAGAAVVMLTAAAGLVVTPVLGSPGELLRKVPPTFERLFASPPIEGHYPAREVAGWTQQKWNDDEDKESMMYRYLHDCTAEGDRLLVSGSTPSDVNYLVGRPFAGGHILWHQRWRTDPEHEAQSLAILRRQSVPFAFSTSAPVLEELEGYPTIRAHFLEHYTEVEGTRGYILVDKRRAPVRRYGLLSVPCFQ